MSATPEPDGTLDPRNPGYRNLQAAMLARVGEFDRALQIYAEVVMCNGDDVGTQLDGDGSADTRS